MGRGKDHGVVPLGFTFFGLYSGGLTALGDKLHYMNRDDPEWSYISIGYIGCLVMLAVILSLPWVHNGMKCCKCCCNCCKECCGSIESDCEDEDE